MKPYFLFLFFLVSYTLVVAQDASQVLLHINDEPITVAEFKSVYLKNSDLLDKSSQDPEKYLELFIPYKLKVQEAYKLGLDKKDTYKTELAGYKKQLAKSFLTDVKITDKLIREAYDRTVNEVKARHILVNLKPNALPQDTLEAYTKVMEARSKVMAGEDFAKVAKEYSADPSAKVNGGDLGWFKAFKMVYPFENAAYGTAVGEISMPFRTRFGYHIVQTTDTRKAQGAVKVGHIMIALKQKDSSVNPQERIHKIYDLLQKGGNFESLAKTYSDDTQTATKGGELRKFEAGQLSSPEFEKVAFQLENPGTYSKPFKTKFGWHITKLIEKFPVQEYDKEKAAIENKVKKDKRSQVISQSLIIRLRALYKLENVANIVAIAKGPTTGSFKDSKWLYNATRSSKSKELFKIGDDSYLLDALGTFLERSFNPKQFRSYDQFFEETVRKYVDVQIRNYHEEHLEEIEPEFATILREYKEGLLIFDLMEKEIWSKAKNDSLGLLNYYQANTAHYKEPEKAIATIYTSQNKAKLINHKQMLSTSAIDQNNKIDASILVTQKALVISDPSSYAKGYSPKVGISDILEYNNGFVVYNVSDITQERLKTLEEAKGVVISDYQEYLEDTWVEQLLSKAIITIDRKVLKKLRKQYK